MTFLCKLRIMYPLPLLTASHTRPFMNHDKNRYFYLCVCSHVVTRPVSAATTIGALRVGIPIFASHLPPVWEFLTLLPRHMYPSFAYFSYSSSCFCFLSRVKFGNQQGRRNRTKRCARHMYVNVRGCM